MVTLLEKVAPGRFCWWLHHHKGSSTCEMPNATPTLQQGGTSSGTESYYHTQGHGEAGPLPAAQEFGDHQSLLGFGIGKPCSAVGQALSGVGEQGQTDVLQGGPVVFP